MFKFTSSFAQKRGWRIVCTYSRKESRQHKKANQREFALVCVLYAKKSNVLPTFLQNSYSYTLFFLLFGLIICAVSSLRDRILILSFFRFVRMQAVSKLISVFRVCVYAPALSRAGRCVSFRCCCVPARPQVRQCFRWLWRTFLQTDAAGCAERPYLFPPRQFYTVVSSPPRFVFARLLFRILF